MTDTALKIVNNTDHDATIRVTVANGPDWPDQNRPDFVGNFQLLVIRARSQEQRNEKVAIGSSKAAFTVTANFTDGSSITFSSQLSDYSTRKVNQCSNGYLVLEDTVSGVLRLTIMPYSHWMGDKMGDIGNRTLRTICIPGSHDAGMCINENAALGNREACVITQKMTIRDQLAMGVRYFDLRVIKGSGKYHTGHYSLQGFLQVGGRGISFDDIIEQINDFTSYCKSEVIILTVSHSVNTDSGYGHFDQSVWEDFFRQLQRLNGLYKVNDSDLTNVMLREFVKFGSSAVVVVVTENPRDLPSINWGSFPWIHQGSAFPLTDQYSNTTDVNVMAKDQLDKMVQYKTKRDDPVFLLSWTLTQGDLFAALGGLFPNSSLNPFRIESLASQANARLNCILPVCSIQSFPNIILLDFVFPDLPILPICHTINNHLAVDETEEAGGGYVLFASLKRQAEGNVSYLDAGDGPSPYMSNWHGRGQTGYSQWKLRVVERGQPYFQIINWKRRVPLAATGEPNRFIIHQDTQSDQSKWELTYFPSQLYGYGYNSAPFCLSNLSYVKNNDGNMFMDPNVGQNAPFVNGSPNVPWVPVCDYTSGNVWRFERPA
eukprot:gene9242-10204_t